jgi:hypothetical protein
MIVGWVSGNPRQRQTALKTEEMMELKNIAKGIDDHIVSGFFEPRYPPAKSSPKGYQAASLPVTGFGVKSKLSRDR